MIYLAFVGAAIGFGLGFAAFGGALGIGKATAAAMEGTARQPEAANDIRTTLIIGSALMEALTIYALVASIMLLTKLPAADVIIEVLKSHAG